VGDTLLVLFNAGAEDVDFTLPPDRRGARWQLLIETALDRRSRWPTKQHFRIAARSVSILRLSQGGRR